MSDNNWIEWTGIDKCPVPAGTAIYVEFRDGKIGPCSEAPTLRWTNQGNAADIIRYRLHQPEQASWNGEGLPPVGTECELVNFYGEDFPNFIGQSGETVKIIGNGFTNSYPVAFYEADGDLGSTLSYAVAKCFRPIRTKAERKREQAIEALSDFFGHAAGLYNLVGLYDAIAAGKISGIKLEE